MCPQTKKDFSYYADLSFLIMILKKILLVVIIYGIFYFNYCVLWLILLIVILVLREQKSIEKQQKKALRRDRSMRDEKEVILSEFEDNLPSWVIFPDIERVEWLNKVAKQLWPCINRYFVKVVRESWEPSIKKKVEKYKFSKFKFETVDIGTVAPRICGVKVYDRNMDRNEIIMDVNVSYTSDCEVTFSLSGIKGGVEDFRLNGTLRIILKPLLSTAPIIGSVQIFFINNPTIDFELVGIAEVLDTPGLNLGVLLKKVIYKKLASAFVLPKKFTKRLTKTVELKSPEPEGILRMHVIGAKHLMKKDVGILGKGKSDPYAVINVGSQEFKTKTIQNTVDPMWDYWCEFVVMEPDAQQILIHVWDSDDASDDERLGRAIIDVSDIVRRGQDDMWITLEQAEHGTVHVRFTWQKLTSNYADLKLAKREIRLLCVSHLCTSLFTIFLDSIKDLPQGKASGPPDTSIVLTVGKDTQKSKKVKKSLDPVYEQSFMFLINNPEMENLYLTVRDRKNDVEIGQFIYQIRNLCGQEQLSLEKQEYSLLNSGPESKIVLAMSLRIFKRDKEDEQFNYLRQESTSSQASEEFSLNEKVEGEQNIVNEIVETSTTIANVTSSPGNLEASKVVHRSPSVTSSAGVHGLGRIQLTVKYSVPRQKIIIEIHRIAHLPLKDPSDIPDPYVKLYLLPERNKDVKRKTQTKKDNCNPTYDETFEYVISEADLSNHKLEISVCTQKQLFYSSRKIMGQVIISLANNFSKPHTAWYDLQPEE